MEWEGTAKMMKSNNPETWLGPGLGQQEWDWDRPACRKTRVKGRSLPRRAFPLQCCPPANPPRLPRHRRGSHTGTTLEPATERRPETKTLHEPSREYIVIIDELAESQLKFWKGKLASGVLYCSVQTPSAATNKRRPSDGAHV